MRRCLIIIILFAMLITSSIGFAACVDSDGGKNFFTQGYATTDGGYTKHQDSCSYDSDTGIHTLHETYCDVNEIKTGTYQCSGGCENGACLCYDPDGEDYYQKRSSTGIFYDGTVKTKTDECIESYQGMTNKFVREWICQDNKLFDIAHECPNGCSDGACLTEEPTCTDSDGGRNYYIRGGLDVGCPEGATCGIWIDSCIMPDGMYMDTIFEYYCENGEVKSEEVICPYNICQDGACVDIWYRYASWTCADGIDVSQGSETSCKSSKAWTEESETYCKTHCNNEGKCGLINGFGTIAMWTECTGEPEECSDSDGLDYYNKGYVYGVAANTIPFDWNFHIDTCNVAKDKVQEQYCGENGLAEEKYFKCPYGCEDGACLGGPIIDGNCAQIGDSCCIGQKCESIDGCYDIECDEDCHPVCIVEEETCAGEGEAVYDMSSKGPTSCCAGLVLKPCEGDCTPSIPGICISQETNEAVNELETVKATVGAAQSADIEDIQDQIVARATETNNYEQQMKERGFSYKFKWFFGMVSEQEKQDALFFKNQSSQLNETAQLLLQISEQVGEPAKSVLIEQANKLEEQSKEFLQKAEDKENHSKGMWSWFSR